MNSRFSTLPKIEKESEHFSTFHWFYFL